MRFPLILVPQELNIDFMRVKSAAFCFSIVLSVLIIISLFSVGLNLGIDFTGGVIIEVRSTQDVHNIRHILNEGNYRGFTIQQVGTGDIVMIRLPSEQAEQQATIVEGLKELLRQHNITEFVKIDYVGPKVGRELVERGAAAMLFALVAMMGYVWMRFDWQYGLGVIIALLHDLLATLGFYVVFRHDFDLTSIAALLTVIGYSINDSVVIYDRIRENVRKYKALSPERLINRSLNETMSRTVMTVLTTVVACLALVMCGGEVLRGFSSAVLFGIIFGTYSSIFVSAPILLYTNFSATKQ